AQSRSTALVVLSTSADSSTKTYRTIPGSVFFNAQYGAQGNSTLVSIKEGDKDTSGLWNFKLKKDA
ncbi:hypothetical protein AB0L17_37120, partial [Streptomyces cellulosae]